MMISLRQLGRWRVWGRAGSTSQSGAIGRRMSGFQSRMEFYRQMWTEARQTQCRHPLSRREGISLWLQSVRFALLSGVIGSLSRLRDGRPLRMPPIERRSRVHRQAARLGIAVHSARALERDGYNLESIPSVKFLRRSTSAEDRLA